MRILNRMIFCLAVSFALSASAAPANPILSERGLLEACSAFSQAGMRDCLAAKAEASRSALRQAEEMGARRLSRWDEDVRYVKRAKARLVAANTDFARYRDAQCQFSASLSGGGAGNGHEIGRLACLASLNNRRAEQLREALSDLPVK